MNTENVSPTKPEGYTDRTAEYAAMQPEEVVAAHHALTEEVEKARRLYKAMMVDIQPYLDAAWEHITAENAKKAPPGLDQTIGME